MGETRDERELRIDNLLRNFQQACERCGEVDDRESPAFMDRAIYRNEIRALLLAAPPSRGTAEPETTNG